MRPKAKKSNPRISGNVIFTAGAILVAVVLIGGVILATRGDSNGKDVSPTLLQKSDSHTLSEAPDETVTLVEFLDFQCPSCSSFYQNVTKQLESDYDGRITFVVRNFPLQMHKLAVPAAQAAEAAAKQGKYAEMYHALFDNYNDWALTPNGQDLSDDETRAREQFDKLATEIGLDLDTFHRDMESDEVAARIETDRADGEKAGVSGTPSFFINGTAFVPEGNSLADVEKQMRTRIDQELDQ